MVAVVGGATPGVPEPPGVPATTPRAADEAAAFSANRLSDRLSDRFSNRLSVRLSVAIVSWNVRDLVLRCLSSVFGSHEVTVDVVLVDNASGDGTVEAVREAFPNVRVIANADNRGFPAANNQAFRAMGVLAAERGGTGLSAEGGHKGRPYTDGVASYTMILNPDTEVAPDALALLVDALAADPALAAVGPRLRYPDGRVQPSRFRDPTPLTLLCESTPLAWHWPNNPVARRYHMADVAGDGAQDVEWLNGAALMFRTEALRAAGGFDEGFFLYSEEADLCRRLRDAGWRIRHEPEAEIVHHEGRSSDQVVAARHVHFQRSRLRYCAKHNGRTAAALVRLGVRFEFAVELLLEALKWMIGHKRPLRAGRVRAYWAVIRSI